MKLEPTGERMIVEEYQSSQEGYLIYLIHVATYKYCMSYVHGKRVLDYGCGTGYGTALIGNNCLRATGIDISSEAISHAKAHYNAPNLTFLTVNKAEHAPLPFRDSSFEIVLSFQVIEHIRHVSAYLQEIQRVLVPGGHVIIATPDRSSRLLPFQKPWNMWHVREYSRDQLHDTLAAHFSNVNIYHMGGQQEVLKIELNRTKKLMWTLLPLTLPFIPETVRISSLRFLRHLQQRLSRHPSGPLKPAFDETALRISNQEESSIDLIAIADKEAFG